MAISLIMNRLQELGTTGTTWFWSLLHGKDLFCKNVWKKFRVEYTMLRTVPNMPNMRKVIASDSRFHQKIDSENWDFLWWILKQSKWCIETTWLWQRIHRWSKCAWKAKLPRNNKFYIYLYIYKNQTVFQTKIKSYLDRNKQCFHSPKCPGLLETSVAPTHSSLINTTIFKIAAQKVKTPHNTATLLLCRMYCTEYLATLTSDFSCRG